LPSTDLADKGIIKQWLYTPNDKNSALQSLSQAFSEVANYTQSYNDLNDIVVLTSEISSSSKSFLNGFLLPNVGFPAWQETVIRILREAKIPKAYLENMQLSNNTLPCHEDIEAVCKLCQKHMPLNRRLLSRTQNEENATPPFRWTTVAGRLDLAGLKETTQVLDFFSRPTWADRMINTTYKVRLMPITEPTTLGLGDYYSIRLADIASFKGLEAERVIFFYWRYYELGFEPQMIADLCVAISRAKHLLFFVGPFDLFETVDGLVGRVVMSSKTKR
jgi:hypothetical protein